MDLKTYPLVLHWLSKTHVQEFFNGEGLKNTLSGLAQYIAEGDSCFIPWVAFTDAVPFALLLTSEPIKKDGEEEDEITRFCEIGEKVVTLDLLIGEEQYLGCGLAPSLIREFLIDHFSHVSQVFIDPQQSNTKAVHVYEKVGFKKLAEFIASWCPEPHWMMHLSMKDLLKYESNNGKRIVESERLYLRELTLADVGNLQKIFSDPVAMQYYPATKDIDETKVWIRKMQQRYTELGYGLWACHLKETGEFVGQCGLILWDDIDGEEELEIGYLFVREFWKRGLAIEAAQVCKKLAKESFQAEKVISLIRPGNVASRRVAERNGMSIEKEITFNTFQTYVYSVRI